MRNFVCAITALFSEESFDIIIPIPNSEVEQKNLRTLQAELPAAWSDTSNAMRGLKEQSLHMVEFDEVLRLEQAIKNEASN